MKFFDKIKKKLLYFFFGLFLFFGLVLAGIFVDDYKSQTRLKCGNNYLMFGYDTFYYIWDREKQTFFYSFKAEINRTNIKVKIPYNTSNPKLNGFFERVEDTPTAGWANIDWVNRITIDRVDGTLKIWGTSTKQEKIYKCQKIQQWNLPKREKIKRKF